VEDTSKVEGKRAAGVLSSSVEKISKSPVQRGDKSAKSPTPSPDGEGTSRVNTKDVNKSKEVRRRLVSTPEQLAEVVADLKGVGLIGLDLETTG
jgi:hypothetical protein